MLHDHHRPGHHRRYRPFLFGEPSWVISFLLILTPNEGIFLEAFLSLNRTKELSLKRILKPNQGVYLEAFLSLNRTKEFSLKRILKLNEGVYLEACYILRPNQGVYLEACYILRPNQGVYLNRIIPSNRTNPTVRLRASLPPHPHQMFLSMFFCFCFFAVQHFEKTAAVKVLVYLFCDTRRRPHPQEGEGGGEGVVCLVAAPEIVLFSFHPFGFFASPSVRGTGHVSSAVLGSYQWVLVCVVRLFACVLLFCICASSWS